MQNPFTYQLNEKQVIHIHFDDMEECMDFKNKLIAFIKKNKRDVRDRGLDPDLIFKFTKNLKNE